MSEIENVTLPLGNYRRTIQHQSERFFRKLFLTDGAETLPVDNFTEEQCDSIIYSLVDDFVTSRLLWAQREPSYCYHTKIDELLVNRLAPLCNNEMLQVIRDDFYKDAIDEVWSTIRIILQRALPEDTWHMWWIRKMRNSIVLEKGTDYRIHVYEEKTKSGEWT